MMRFALGLLAVLSAPSLLFAQSPNVIRGCVTVSDGVRLRPLAGSLQHFDSHNLVNPDDRFLLFADDALLDEIALHEGHEIEVTGHINPPPPEPIVEPPILPPPGGVNLPGVGVPPNTRGLIRMRSSGTAATDVIVVEEFKILRPECRAFGRF